MVLLGVENSAYGLTERTNKMNRRVYEKYENHEVYGALILKRLKPCIGSLLTFLESKLAAYETISVHEWIGERFYIIVNDNRIKGFPGSAAVGFTVDIDDDKFIFVKPSEKFPFGGNCFVRGLKWKRLLKTYYTHDYNADNFRIYRSEPLDKIS
jgi:hypothetical protein